jgi:hypothetical protein
MLAVWASLFISIAIALYPPIFQEEIPQVRFYQQISNFSH